MNSSKTLNRKRETGCFYTHANPFQIEPFYEWSKVAGLPQNTILEPFAGSNNLIEMLIDMGLCDSSVSYDINPTNQQVRRRDTLLSFPNRFDVCVTNPPWLAKNSATARGLEFPVCDYDDVYKFAMEKCLDNCDYVAALVPESFITANLFLDRLQSFVSLTNKMFIDTGHPVGLALFIPDRVDAIRIWSGETYVGNLYDLKRKQPTPNSEGVKVKFNDPEGNVGLIAVDNTREASIRFCDVKELENYVVKHTSRAITKLAVDGSVRIAEWNDALNYYRQKTSDVLMTSFKGIRADGMYRRRCDWALARGLIHYVG